jgi:hypothetical protein
MNMTNTEYIKYLEHELYNLYYEGHYNERGDSKESHAWALRKLNEHRQKRE